MTNRFEQQWKTSDEWFSDFIEKLESTPKRRGQLWRECVVVPPAVEVARAFQEKTEQLRRMIAVERKRSNAGMRTA